MPGFNHYAKLARMLADQPPGWYIRRIDEPTQAQNFKGETVEYDYYYRLYSHDDRSIKYGKFQQLERLAGVLGVDPLDLPVLGGEA
ncbi:hypothetical protein IPM09_05375 [Candidatus Saccharibacteria bacterium]|nr:MAG: hypothetical protein IPM09_05375 [Candidatus Saccharibacteria bacterium]